MTRSCVLVDRSTGVVDIDSGWLVDQWGAVGGAVHIEGMVGEALAADGHFAVGAGRIGQTVSRSWRAGWAKAVKTRLQLTCTNVDYDKSGRADYKHNEPIVNVAKSITYTADKGAKTPTPAGICRACRIST